MLMGKKLLILGGSRISCEIVRKAKAMGIKTGVTDWYAYDKSPAKQMADYWYDISTSDIDAMVTLIKEEKYDGVITGFTDSVLPYYAEICKKAGVPSYGTKEQFEIMINKNRYKKLCKEYDVPVVNQYYVGENFKEADLSEIKYPVLVKPSDSSGARGISICDNKEQLYSAYEKALSFSEAKEVIIERYISGDEVTVFWTFIDGEIYLSGIGNRHLGKTENGVKALPVAYTFPSVHIKSYVENIQPKVEKMLKSIGIKNGMMFMQCLIENDECIVYDIGYRLTGSLEYILIEEICGYNPMEMMIHFALTGKMTVDPSIHNRISPFWNQYGCNVSYLIKAGTIKTVEGLDKLKGIPGVLNAVQAYVPGETLEESSVGTLKQIALRAFGLAKDIDTLKELLDQMYQAISITGLSDAKLLIDGLEVSDIEGKLQEV